MPKTISLGRLLAAMIVSTLLLSCSTEPASAPKDIPTDELGPNAALIRSPVDGNQAVADTTKVAKMTFENNEFRFGEVPRGEVVEHDFAFTNTGSQPLLITKARSTCGCTVPSYPEEPILPGESGVISVAFDTKNKYGRQRKPITITANTLPAMSVIYMDGTILND
ncbi:MAG: DUF1573 domain-containing protein [Bacteroidota bacterium]